MNDAPVTIIDDCWNRIGVRGDSSCERLADYVRCLNCPVFETAAAKLLERPIPDVQLPRHEIAPSRHLRPEGQGATESFVVFRIDDEWLALPTHVLQRIVPVRPIHTLPHRKHRAVLGIVNVQGELLVCLSLALLLGFEPQAESRDTNDRNDRRDQPRLLVVARGDEHAVLPVRQVDGVHRLAIAGFQPPPATLSETAARHTRAIAPWRGVTVGLLDADCLFDTLNRSLG